MLLSSFFILDFEKAADSLDISLPENAFYCYRIPDGSLDESYPINKKLLLSYKRNQFCFLVNINKEKADFEKSIESLIPYTFFYNYLKFSYENPLVIFETDRPDSGRYTAVAKEIFKQHGYDDLDTIILNTAPVSGSSNTREKITCFNFQESDNKLSMEYINAVKNVRSADSVFLFFLNDFKELSVIFEIANEAETTIQKQFPQTYHLLNEIGLIKIKEREMIFKLGLQKEQLNSITNYHLYYNASDNRYKRQIKELLGFYKNEYEILPMWYKRFGHVLKVMTGKRTFKSLFDDNVKKYNV